MNRIVTRAPVFYAEGYNVVLWGRSGRTIQYGDKGIRDVLRVVQHVRDYPAVDPNKVFVFGLSLGAAMALGAAAKDDKRHIAGVIADSPYSDLKSAALHYVTAFGCIPKIIAWPTAFVMFQAAEAVHHVRLNRCNPIDWAGQIRCPVLLIHGKNDWRVLPEHSARLFDTITCRKDFWLVEGTGHHAGVRPPSTRVCWPREPVHHWKFGVRREQLTELSDALASRNPINPRNPWLINRTRPLDKRAADYADSTDVTSSVLNCRAHKFM